MSWCKSRRELGFPFPFTALAGPGGGIVSIFLATQQIYKESTPKKEGNTQQCRTIGAQDTFALFAFYIIRELVSFVLRIWHMSLFLRSCHDLDTHVALGRWKA